MLSVTEDILYQVLLKCPYQDSVFCSLRRVSKHIQSIVETICIEKLPDSQLSQIWALQIKLRTITLISLDEDQKLLKMIKQAEMIIQIFGRLSIYEALQKINPVNPLVSTKIRRYMTNRGELGFAMKCTLEERQTYPWPRVISSTYDVIAFAFGYDVNRASKYVLVKSKSGHFSVSISDVVLNQFSKFLKNKGIELEEITPSGNMNRFWRIIIDPQPI